MAKKKFEIGYHHTTYCCVTVEAETEEEALEMWDNGEIELSTWDNLTDSDEEEFDYIEECEDNSNLRIDINGKIIEEEEENNEEEV